MRLINVSTRKTEEFYGNEVPKYAILSHTWGLRETSYQAMQSWSASFKKWPTKLSGLYLQAAALEIPYVWADTCCINKLDLVELSEAINSMFKWYQNASVCVVYLADFELDLSGTGNREAFRSSRWFTRGWTLQELLAPAEVLFYDAKWNYVGKKMMLSREIEAATGIPRGFITGATTVGEASVAQRFSWAANQLVVAALNYLVWSFW